MIYHLCNIVYERLTRNVVNNIVHPVAPRVLRTLFTANRSYQENRSEYKSVDRYMREFFQEADVCVLSSHPERGEITEMINGLRMRCYNVAGVFWSNSYGTPAQNIATLSWDEVLRIENPEVHGDRAIAEQLDRLAKYFTEMIIARSHAR